VRIVRAAHVTPEETERIGGQNVEGQPLPFVPVTQSPAGPGGVRNRKQRRRIPRTFNNGHLAIRFDAITGRTYRVDWKEHLEDATWNPLAMPAVAAGTSVTVTDQVQPGSQRFYRIVQLD
jgi:hypothetical protein